MNSGLGVSKHWINIAATEIHAIDFDDKNMVHLQLDNNWLRGSLQE